MLYEFLASLTPPLPPIFAPRIFCKFHFAFLNIRNTWKKGTSTQNKPFSQQRRRINKSCTYTPWFDCFTWKYFSVSATHIFAHYWAINGCSSTLLAVPGIDRFPSVLHCTTTTIYDLILFLIPYNLCGSTRKYS